jgi:hypothetical protein
MSRDFILIFSGGMVSLITTIVVLFVADYIYRRSQLLVKSDTTRAVESKQESPSAPVSETKAEPPHPPESKLQVQKDNSS